MIEIGVVAAVVVSWSNTGSNVEVAKLQTFNGLQIRFQNS